MQRISAPFRNPLAQAWPLHNSAATRQLEHAAQAALPTNALMQRAGLAVARLALALAPHARTVWIACGPGNNGGDGAEAALHLQRWGKQPVLTRIVNPNTPPDAEAAWARVAAAGIPVVETPPSLTPDDLAIDALLGIGSTRAPEGALATHIDQLNRCGAPVLAIDLPSGLLADTGAGTHSSHVVQARWTLTLLTLKPGLFTVHGRDAAGEVWFDALGCEDLLDATPATAWLNSPPPSAPRPHASHKGSHGDVAIIGGAAGMVGAAWMAASAALHGGAGRVFVSTLAPADLPTNLPELMQRPLVDIDLAHTTVVCGCGGGAAVAAVLPQVLADATTLVLDADALNAVAQNTALQTALRQRAAQQQTTVLTPHPLEAARLLGCSTADIQNDRLAAAERLAAQFQCVVVLKGSGTVIAGPGQVPHINPTGNARLGTAGTGDVLAGLLGARIASVGKSPAATSVLNAACAAVYQHGAAADLWPTGTPLTAGALAQSLNA